MEARVTVGRGRLRIEYIAIFVRDLCPDVDKYSDDDDNDESSYVGRVGYQERN